MRIILETPPDDGEEEIIIRCHKLDDEIMQLIYAIKAGRTRITGYENKNIVQLYINDIYYFETVDDKTFAYCEKKVYEIHQRLYEVEENCRNSGFLRVSKSVIVNIDMIDSVSPMLGARLDAKLRNGEHIIISRQYVPDLKRKLGIVKE